MIAPGEISSDGRSKWDGQKWVPIGTKLWTLWPSDYAQNPRALAIVSVVAGVLSWVFFPVFGGFTAVIVGHAARRQIRKTGGPGAGLAMAGLIIGYVHLAVAALVIAAIVAVELGLFVVLPAVVGR